MGRTIDRVLHNNRSAVEGFSAKVHTIRVGNDAVETQTVGLNEDFPEPGNGTQWIHLPVNNLAWVAVCFAKCNRELDPRITTMKMRPVFSQKAETATPAERITPAHARHLEPSCTEGGPPQSIPRHELSPSESSMYNDSTSSTDGAWLPPLSIYLPYMSWMRYDNYLSMAITPGNPASDTTPSQAGVPAKLKMKSARQSQPSSSSEAALVHVNTTSSYPRRTLDQFYYPALDDTSARDGDQTISKWSGKSFGRDGRVSASPDSVLLMVDQLWCWVVDEQTIITSFPSENSHEGLPDFQDLYQTIRSSLWRSPTLHQTVWDIHALVMKESISYMFSQQNKNFEDLVEIYRWVTGKKAACQTTYFQEFQQGYASGGSDADIFNDRRDLKLVLEVADIIDELKMIKHLLLTQQDVLRSSIPPLTTKNPSDSAKGIPPHLEIPSIENLGIVAKNHVKQARETLERVLGEIKSIDKDAEHTRKMLINLLDLKSNAASLVEARSSAKEAQAATTQGRAVMLFTIITVIFLPLSFFTSYFGQNVKEITGDARNPSSWDLWRIATPIIIVVIVIALLIAYYITQPSSPVWFWKHWTSNRLSRAVKRSQDDVEAGHDTATENDASQLDEPTGKASFERTPRWFERFNLFRKTKGPAILMTGMGRDV